MSTLKEYFATDFQYFCSMHHVFYKLLSIKIGLKKFKSFCASGRKKRRAASTRKFPGKRKHGPRHMVLARAAMPDEFSSVTIKTVPQVPVELKLRSAKARKPSASKRALMQILLIQNSRV